MLPNSSPISKKYHGGGAPPGRGKGKAKAKKQDPHAGTMRILQTTISARAFSDEEDQLVDCLVASVLFTGRPYEVASGDVATMKQLVREYTHDVQVKFIRDGQPGGPAHAIYPMPNAHVAKELAAFLLKRMPQAFPGFTVGDISVVPEIANKEAPKMTILVSDTKAYGSGIRAPKSIFVVMNENVSVLNVKAQYTFPPLFFNTFSDVVNVDEPTPVDMYEALIASYTEEYLTMLKNFYTHHGFDVEVVEELVGDN